MSEPAMTSKSMLEAAKQSRQDGYPGLAEVFERLADKICTFNETSSSTLEDIRQRIGNDKFFEIISSTQDSE